MRRALAALAFILPLGGQALWPAPTAGAALTLDEKGRQEAIRAGERSFVQNERTAHRQDNGRYLARCVYGFPTADLDGRARASLIVVDGDGRDVSTFALDLAKMR